MVSTDTHSYNSGYFQIFAQIRFIGAFFSNRYFSNFVKKIIIIRDVTRLTVVTAVNIIKTCSGLMIDGFSALQIPVPKHVNRHL